MDILINSLCFLSFEVLVSFCLYCFFNDKTFIGANCIYLNYVELDQLNF